jgi:lambda family phage portal protein
MSDGIPIPVEIQALESDMLPLTDITPNGGILRDGDVVNQGVVFNAKGKRRWYLMYRNHPSDLIDNFTTFSSTEVVRIPARDISHVYDADRPGQVRGLPWGACVLEDMVALDEYLYNEAVRQESQSNIAAFITGADPELNQGLGAVEQDAETLEYIDTLTPGMVRHLAHGETINFAVPQVSQGLSEYAKQVLHKIAAGWGLSYAQLTGDLTSVNFSSGRMGHLDAAEMQGNSADAPCHPARLPADVALVH